MKEKQLLTNTEWEVCECLWEESPLTMTQIAARLTERTGWTKSTGETLVRRMADKGLLRWEQGRKAKLFYPTVGGGVGLLVNTMAEQEELSREEIDQLYETLRKLEEKGHD